ncbi:hypothetical protein C6H68_21320 [Photorhabdus luminescens]|nr:hypothetical protein C6H68_21320 [Photorhabdus luminescens]
MLDIKLVREKPELIQQICNNRGLDFDVSQIIALDQRKRKIQQELELLRAESKKTCTKPCKIIRSRKRRRNYSWQATKV